MPMIDGYAFGAGWLVMLFFWVFVIAGIVWLVLAFGRQQLRGGGGTGALGILQERLARGEIDVEEFRARSAALSQIQR